MLLISEEVKVPDILFLSIEKRGSTVSVVRNAVTWQVLKNQTVWTRNIPQFATFDVYFRISAKTTSLVVKQRHTSKVFRTEYVRDRFEPARRGILDIYKDPEGRTLVDKFSAIQSRIFEEQKMDLKPYIVAIVN